jgi:hypothetical protein
MRRVLPILFALVVVPAALSAPKAQTISGTISANTGASITVSSADRSLSCAVLGQKPQAALARWGVGAKAAMACRQNGDRLFLATLKRLGSTEHKDGTPTTPNDGTTAGNGTTTHDGTTTGERHPTPPPPPPPPAPTPPPTTTPAPTPPPTTAPDRRDARGVVTVLSSDGVTVRPDAGGDSLRCRITPATDSAAAASKLSLGAHAGIVCRRDGDGYVLSAATLIG